MAKKIAVLGLVIGLLLAGLLPGASGRANAAPAARTATIQVDSAVHARAAFLDKTRFLLHMGAAYYAFHHFVYARYKSGGFASGASHRTSNMVKAGIALLFSVHELKVAYGIANGSNSKLLHALVSPINALVSKASGEATKLKGGNFSTSDLNTLNSSYTGVSTQANTNGYGFKDVTVPVPGAA
jgi:hypothetical protein